MSRYALWLPCALLLAARIAVAQTPPSPPEEYADSEAAVDGAADSAFDGDGCFAQSSMACCEAAPPMCCRPKRWFAQGDAIWLRRDADPSFWLAREVDGAGQQVGAREMSLRTVSGFEQQAGFRALLGYRVGCRGAVEFSYFGLNFWQDDGVFRHVRQGAVSVQSPFLGSSIPTADNGFQVITARYNSELHNAEANLRWHMIESPCGTLSVLSGVRYLNWREELTLRGKDDNVINREETTRTRAFNNLIGFQVGSELTHGFLDGLFHSGISGKAGVYGNAAAQRTTNVYTGPANGVGLEGYNSAASLAGVFEASLHGSLLVTDNLRVRGGYQVMYITGIASAPGNLGLTETVIRDINPPNLPAPPGAGQGIANHSDVFLHGPWVGAELRF